MRGNDDWIFGTSLFYSITLKHIQPRFLDRSWLLIDSLGRFADTEYPKEFAMVGRPLFQFICAIVAFLGVLALFGMTGVAAGSEPSATDDLSRTTREWLANIPDYELRFFERLKQVEGVSEIQTIILLVAVVALLLLGGTVIMFFRTLERRIAALPGARPQSRLSRKIRLLFVMWRQKRLEDQFSRIAAIQEKYPDITPQVSNFRVELNEISVEIERARQRKF
ncbi:hypothetical protein [Paramagnetospirillum kuznetsovii]|uniref:hypothetical protein n=1 Tax=Paramagnetospirillum kuznetsovii TaxID=2053833 RepID=UPI0013753483|nr:hypothetical protein [Paramagnetospirillum kuznetsovii]